MDRSSLGAALQWPITGREVERRQTTRDGAGENMKWDSELCLRIAKRLADLDGRGAIVDFSCPDDPENTKSAQPGEQFIDLIATAADGAVIALEHTTIESFEYQLHEARQLEALLLPLENQFDGQLPTDRTYRLAVGIGAVADPTLDPTEVQAGLIPWIVATAPTLPAGDPGVAPHHQAHGRPPLLPVDVVLSAWPPTTAHGGGQLTVWRFGDSDASTMLDRRVARLRTAMSRKLPKLLAHDRSHTVLVLEDVDLSMSNISDVWTALQRAAEGVQLCQTIVVVETAVAPPTGTVVYDAHRWLPDFDNRRFPLPAIDASDVPAHPSP